MSFATVLVLLYGPHTQLHRRCLTSVLETVPSDTPLRIGINDVCSETLTWLERGALDPQLLVPGTLAAGNLKRGIEQGRVAYFSSGNTNVCKYPMWRRMLWEAPKITTPWIVWLDDDTHCVNDRGWWRAVEALAADPQEHYIGESWWVTYQKKQWESFIITRPWYKGQRPETIGGKPGVRFHTGGFVAARLKTLKTLGWPDTELYHNGGDTLLGEAMRQNGFKRTALDTKVLGLRVNDSPRRGHSEKPKGQ